MGPDSRRPQSGLGTVKRDWSDSVGSSDPDFKPRDSNLSAIKNAVSKQEQRLKYIRDGLAGNIVQSDEVVTDASSKVVNKRPRRSVESDLFKPPTKYEVLNSSTNWSISSSSRTSDVAPRPNLSTPSSKVTKKPASVFLSPEQLHIKRLVEEGQSIFYTGSAGKLFFCSCILLRIPVKVQENLSSFAKSLIRFVESTGLLKTLSQSQRRQVGLFIYSCIRLTWAIRGLAACNIGGVTVHSFAGIGLGVESAEHLADKVKKNRKAMTRWLRTKVLVIDEGKAESSFLLFAHMY
jgi:hypothetical protein